MAQGTTKGLPIDIDGTLSANSDMLVASQKAVKTYADTKISSIIGTSPIVSSGGTTPSISIPQASGSADGYLSSTDWTTFNSKQDVLTNPITGTGTNNQIAVFNSTGSTITSLNTSTYPTLTELSYVKGVTSSIQTQLDSKGVGNMILASAQTNSGAKTFLDTSLLLRNVANTFNGSFTNTNTADRVYTLPDAAGTIALTSNLTSYVPYTGASSNVNLGANSLFTTILGVGISSSLSATAHVRGSSASSGSSFLVQNSTPVNIFNVLNNGFVGIGTNTPISLLHIGTSSGTSLGDFTTPVITFNTLNNGIYLDANRIFFKVAGAFNFGLDSTGAIGNQFRINGATSNNLTTPIFVPYRLNAAGLASGFGGNSAGDICLITNSTTRLRINTNGDLGFFGVTPVARQTLGAATAASTYGTNEQGMLQRVYDAIRNYGLGT